MPAGNANYDALLSTTLANHRDNMDDNLSSNVLLYKWLNEKGRARTESGGAYIIEPLLYGENTTAGSFSMYDPLTLTPQAGISAARYEWSNYNVSVAIAGEEKRKNNGPEQIVNLLKAKVKQAEITISEMFNAHLMSKAAPGNSGKNFQGINVLIGDASSTVTTVGGIDATDAANAWWRSYVERTAGVLTLEDIGLAFHRASRGTARPDLALTTLALYMSFEAQLQPAQRFTDPKLAEVGFDNLVYHGARVAWDDDVATGDWTWINSDYVGLVKHSDAWLSQTPFDSPSGIDASYAHIISMGGLTTSHRKLAGSRLEARTAS